MIGGLGQSYIQLDNIAKFENNKWSLHGNLQKARGGQGSITSGTQTIIIGGLTTDYS